MFKSCTGIALLMAFCFLLSGCYLQQDVTESKRGIRPPVQAFSSTSVSTQLSVVTQTTEKTTTTQAPTTTKRDEVVTDVNSPFKGLEIKSINFKVKGNMFDTETEDVMIVRETDKITQIQTLLTGEKWDYYKDEGSWVKCMPYYAKRIMIFESKDGQRLVLHILYDNEGYVSLGIMGNVYYNDYIKEAIEKSKKGVSYFKRYKISKSLVEELCNLF